MKIPRISDSEWQVMKIIWKNSPLTSEEVIAALSATSDWSPQTIKTFLNRLLKKGAIGYEKTGRSYAYYPKVSEQECVLAESKSFMKRISDGAAAMLFASFIEEKALSDEEIARLQELLEGRKRQ